jgi:L-lysine exporter family protein LysE/ArgO
MILPLLHGLAVTSGLIIAVGPQNSFVISQGIKREYVLLCAVICSLIDAALITLGIVGLGALFNLHPMFIVIARYFGVTFLLAYACFAFKAALHPRALVANDLDKKHNSYKRILIMLLCFSLLNPHVYLDTVILIGSIASQENPGSSQYLFGLGAVLASTIWFFAIAFGAKILTPIFKNKKAWRVLDCVIGVTMLTTAMVLLLAPMIKT